MPPETTATTTEGADRRPAVLQAIEAEKVRRQALDALDAEEARRAPSMAGGLTRAVSQGATFGFSDEVEAAIRSLWDRGEGESFASAYYRNRNQIRGHLDRFRSDHPGVALGAEIAGGFLVPGLGTAGVAGRLLHSAPTLANMALRGAAVGAVEGSLFGAGKAEELPAVPGEASLGATIGAGVGAVVPAGVDLVRSALAPASGAARRIEQALLRDETTPAQVQRRLAEARRLGRPAIIADVAGENTRRELEVAVQSPGRAAQRGEQFLSARNKQQLGRLSRDLVRQTGANATDVEQAIRVTMATRAEAAAPVYQRAMAFAAELDDDLVDAYAAAIKTPLGKQALVKARRILNVEDFNDAPLMERIDALKRGLDDIVSSAQRGGENAVARRAIIVKNDLVELVDAVNPDYRHARQIWENDSSYLDAIDRGREILQPSFTSAKLQGELADLTDAEKEAFRIGAVDAVITRMRQQSAQEPNLLRIIRSPEIMDKLTAIMEPKQAERFRRIVDIEDAMFRTAAQARGNSATARRQAVMSEQEKEARLLGALSTLTGLAIEGVRTVLFRALPAIPRAARERLIARQNALIAQRLMGMDAAQALQGASRTGPGVTGAAAIPPAIIGAAQATGRPLLVDIRDDDIPGRNPSARPNPTTGRGR